MEPEHADSISQQPPPGFRGTLVLSDALLGKSDSAAVILRSMVGYDEGVTVETEFLLRRPGIEARPLRGALDPQNADPAISFGANAEGDFRSLSWNDVGEFLSAWTLSADEGHSRLTIRTWIEPPPEQLVIGVRWLSQEIQATHLRVDCRHRESWSAPLWPHETDQPPG